MKVGDLVKYKDHPKVDMAFLNQDGEKILQIYSR